MRQKVYLIANDLSGFIKIGISREPKKRKAGLESACGYRLRLVAARTPKREAREVELELHELFKGRRKLGEWFDIDEETAKQALLKACPVAKPSNNPYAWRRHWHRRRRG
ncbi:GIY-YIG nuclease family protein [Aliagarivorans taiwanensis]|uniref:GIY-YIG nuclease family protein n=1 Tax=Aliagarivorans taiwanensis TaxID=561966 RepID=UPI0003FA2AF6|nr:GIY-YIG nuclease family protein [Aliagarivorans taiwanensis]